MIYKSYITYKSYIAYSPVNMFEHCKDMIEKIAINDVEIKKVLIAINVNRLEYFNDYINTFYANVLKEFVITFQNSTSAEEFIANSKIEFRAFTKELSVINKFLKSLKANVDAILTPGFDFTKHTKPINSVNENTLIMIKTHLKSKIVDVLRDIITIWAASNSIDDFVNNMNEKIDIDIATINSIVCKLITKELKFLAIKIEKISIDIGTNRKLIELNKEIDNLWDTTANNGEELWIKETFVSVVFEDIKMVKRIIIMKLAEARKVLVYNKDECLRELNRIDAAAALTKAESKKVKKTKRVKKAKDESRIDIKFSKKTIKALEDLQLRNI